jgi:hypothetical protein
MANTPEAPTQPAQPEVLPDVATQLHPVASAQKRDAPANDLLQKVLPEINHLAQKVGGFKKLSEIADTLEQTVE